ncbi:MAG: hydrogenase iron-sulfur subunit [Candidatus Hydrogenedentota bacterium]|nr:MAG: hydrogenase iron-sulfur subunit [Candidatus Hydrogenedentota bacterium]
MNSTETIDQTQTHTMGKEPKIAAFCCYHSAYEAADVAGSMHLRVPEGVRLIRVPCTGRVDVLHILRAVEKGYDGILVLGCHEENCKFLRGNILARKRVAYARELLTEAGAGEKDLEFHSVAANQPHRFARVVCAMRDRLASERAEHAEQT